MTRYLLLKIVNEPLVDGKDTEGKQTDWLLHDTCKHLNVSVTNPATMSLSDFEAEDKGDDNKFKDSAMADAIHSEPFEIFEDKS